MPLGLSRERFPSFLWPNVGQSQRNSAGLVRPGLPREDSSPTWCARGFRAKKRCRLGDTATASPRKRLDSARPGPRAKKTPRLGGTAAPLPRKRLDLASLASLAKEFRRLGEPRAPLQRNSADLARSGLLRKEKVPSWCPCSRFAKNTPRLGASPAKSRRFLCNGGSARPTRGNIFARGPRCSQIEAISLQGSSSGPTRCAIFAAGKSRSQPDSIPLPLSERWPSRQRFFAPRAMAFRCKVGFPAHRQPPFLSSHAARSTSSRAA